MMVKVVWGPGKNGRLLGGIFGLSAGTILTSDHRCRIKIDNDNIEQKENKEDTIVMVFGKLQPRQRIDCLHHDQEKDGFSCISGKKFMQNMMQMALVG